MFIAFNGTGRIHGLTVRSNSSQRNSFRSVSREAPANGGRRLGGTGRAHNSVASLVLLAGGVTSTAATCTPASL